MDRDVVNLLATRTGQRVLFGALYLSEGAPIGFIWWALPTQLRAAGVPIDEITVLTSVLVLPWVFKFLWAPAVDALQSRRWTLRSWILSMQLAMGISLIPLFWMESITEFGWIVPALIVHAVAAATQDAAIDAWVISAVPDSERGSINGWMQAGMLLGRSALGGGALLLSQEFGWVATVVLLIVVIWASSILVLITPPTHALREPEMTIRKQFLAVFDRLRHVSTSSTTWYGLGFAAVAGAGFEAVGGVAGPFLIDRGVSMTTIATFFSVFSVGGMAVGAVAGGMAADRFGVQRTTAWGLVLLAAVIGGIAGIDAAFPEANYVLFITTLTMLYALIGLFTAASYALFMQITDRTLGATQFSAFMGATNGCESWSAYAVGRLVPAAGYAGSFLIMALVSLTAIPFLRKLPRSS